jgi:hypothetical protein
MVGSLMMTVMREKIIAEEIGMIVHVHQLEVHVIVEEDLLLMIGVDDLVLIMK